VATPAGQRRRGHPTAVGRVLDLSPPTLLLIAALCASAFLLLLWQSDLTFFFDEWNFLLHRQGLSADVILAPHNEHIAILPVLVYKTVLTIFGMDSPQPFQVAGTAAFLASVVVLFVYIRRRVGGWLALAGVLPVLFFGPSWIDLLWPFQIAFWGSLIGGIAALLLLERDERRADVLACLLLGVSMASSSLGIPFAIGIGVLIATGRDRRRRAFVVAIPVALFALWWLGWGREAENNVSFDNLVDSPVYVIKGVASSLASLLGLAGASDTSLTTQDWRWPVLAIALVLAAWRIHRLRGGGRWLWATLAIVLSFWFLAAVNADLFRDPEDGRYQVVGAILILLVAAELLRGIRVSTRAVIVAGAVAVAATASNISSLHHGWERFAPGLEVGRASVTALEISADSVPPNFTILVNVDAQSYLSAVEAHGSPAYTQQQLAEAPEVARAEADKTMAAALGLRLTREPASAAAIASRCERIALGADPAIIELPPDGAVLRASPGSEAQVALRRYASESLPVGLGTVSAGSAESLAVPADRSSEPWELGLTGSGKVAVCERR
jgi:hypothetical protein